MRPEIFATFDKLVGQQKRFLRVLEIGAQGQDDDLINLPSLMQTPDKFAIGNDCPDEYINDIQYINMNANDMKFFNDGFFDLVVCNSMLEHDPYFWKTLAEIHRIIAPNGMFIVGVPIFDGMGLKQYAKQQNFIFKTIGLLARLFKLEALNVSALTLGVHAYPDDFYRFSPSAVKTIFMSGFENVVTVKLLTPPRLIAYGFKV